MHTDMQPMLSALPQALYSSAYWGTVGIALVGLT